jgi:hypothetical protein
MIITSIMPFFTAIIIISLLPLSSLSIANYTYCLLSNSLFTDLTYYYQYYSRGGGEGGRRGSLSRSSSFQSRGSRMTRETQSQAGNNDSSSATGKIIEMDEELEFSDLDSTASMFKVLQRVKKLKLRDTKGDSGEKINEFEAIKEEIGNALNATDLKGKNYVIDKEGRLLTVDPVRPESLPPFAVPLKTTISEKSIDDGHLRFSLIHVMCDTICR